MPKLPVLVLAWSVSVGFALGGCAAVPLSDRETAMPVFKAAQVHPAVIRALGPVKAYVCLWSKNQASYADEALSSLRSRADAKGATALVDYRIEVLARPPRAQQCQHYAQAQAVAVVLAGA
jgi:hypothetical protein